MLFILLSVFLHCICTSLPPEGGGVACASLQGVSLSSIGEDRACGLFGALPLDADRPLLLVDTDKFLKQLHI